MVTERLIPLVGAPRYVQWPLRGVGLVFFLVGGWSAAGMFFGFGHMTVSINDGPSRPATPEDAWVPGLMALVGLGMLFFRSSAELDVERRSCIKSIGWGPWVRRKETSLATATRLVIGPVEERGSGSGRYTVCPVSAVGSSGSKELADTRTYKAARQLAQRIALALNIPIESCSVTDGARKRTSALDRPVAEAELGELDGRRPPTGTRVTVADVPRGVEIRYPLTRSGIGRLVLQIAVPVLVFGGIWWFQCRPGLMSSASLPIGLFLAVPILLGFFTEALTLRAAYRAGLFGGRMLVDRDGRLTISGRTISREQVMAIEVTTKEYFGNGLRIVLPTSEFVTAKGQSLQDLEWMRALIIRALGSAHDPRSSADAAGVP